MLLRFYIKVRLVKNLTTDLEFPSVRKRVRSLDSTKKKEKNTKVCVCLYLCNSAFLTISILDIIFF